MASKKKIVHASDLMSDESKAKVAADAAAPTWAPTAAAKARAVRLRVVAAALWVLAIATEAAAIFWALRQSPVKVWLVIVLIVVDLLLAVGGSLLWKQANRLDPASRKDSLRFWVQNQLGLIVAIVAFLPLVVLVFVNKDLGGKQKALVGAVAVGALVIAGAAGLSIGSPSVEQYAAQTQEVENLTGHDVVYFTAHGTRYHLHDDCYHINGDRTEEIISGTVAEARAYKNITKLCETCRARAEKAKGVKPEETTLPTPDVTDDEE